MKVSNIKNRAQALFDILPQGSETSRQVCYIQYLLDDLESVRPSPESISLILEIEEFLSDIEKEYIVPNRAL